MIISKDLKYELHSWEYCGICHKRIKQEAAIYREGFHLGVLCPSCSANNSEEDIELISNMLIAFGGYFGMLRDPCYPVNELLKCLLKEIEKKKGNLSPECLRIRLMYLALLHGVSPQEFKEIDEDLLKYMYRL
ncbi:MAG: hypothetical protein ACFFEN_00500 [Candidatus Thorarchaeota archaeon]